MLNPEGSVDRGEERKNHSRLPVGGVTGTCMLFTGQLCMFVRVLYMDLRMCVVCTYIYFCMCISVRLCRVGMCLHLFVHTCICMCVCYVGMCVPVYTYWCIWRHLGSNPGEGGSCCPGKSMEEEEPVKPDKLRMKVKSAQTKVCR